MNFGNKGYLVVAGLRQQGEQLPSARVEALRGNGNALWSNCATGSSWDLEGWSFFTPLVKKL